MFLDRIYRWKTRMMMLVSRQMMFSTLVCWFIGITTSCAAVEPFRIQIVDAENQWPVPLVELKTTHHVRFVSDNNGLIAFDLPELMHVPTWFHVEGHGYSVPEDGFGYQGLRLIPRPGESFTLKVNRQLPAKRLGRITGGGLFAESQKLGVELTWREQGLLGCDSVQNAVHDGKMFWSWGDTVLPGYPLGRFHMIGATTPIRPIEAFHPPIRLRYDYFVDQKQIPRNIAVMSGSGPTWLSGFASLRDTQGRSRLVATYSKIKPPLKEYERGLCVWNDEKAEFEKFLVHWAATEQSKKPPPAPVGHAVITTDEGGEDWILFGDPFPSLRCRPTFESWADPDQWEILEPQPSVPTDQDPSNLIKPHRGAIAWSSFRNKWVAVFTQLYGDSSALGELWYAEADKPLGPWGKAIKVVTHSHYSFYNPQLHPEFTETNSPILLFEATYTKTFSANQEPTPRHNYNQILYRLDLDELHSHPPNDLK